MEKATHFIGDSENTRDLYYFDEVQKSWMFYNRALGHWVKSKINPTVHSNCRKIAA